MAKLGPDNNFTTDIYTYTHIYIYICRRVSFGTTFLPFRCPGTVPHKKNKSFPQQPEANQELETDPPDS